MFFIMENVSRKYLLFLPGHSLGIDNRKIFIQLAIEYFLLFTVVMHIDY